MSSTEELVRAANPVRTSDVPRGDSPEARRLLASLTDPAAAPPGGRVAGDRARLRRAPRPRRLALGGVAVAGLTAAIVAGVTVAGPAGPGPARPRGALGELVLAAYHHAAAPALQPGQFQYTESVSLNETDTYPGDGPGFTVDYAQHRQAWIGADGSGRIAQTSADPTFPTAADRAHWIANGRPSLAVPPSDDRFGPGGLSAGPGVNLRTLTTDPAKLAKLISGRKLEGGPSGVAEDFTQVGDLLRETSAPPALRAALFKVAGRLPGVTVIPHARDHSGRPGIALAIFVKVPAGPDKGALDRHELIFDPATSTLLGEDSGFVSPATRAVTDPSWTVYLKSFIVDSASSAAPVTASGS